MVGPTARAIRVRLEEGRVSRRITPLWKRIRLKKRNELDIKEYKYKDKPTWWPSWNQKLHMRLDTLGMTSFSVPTESWALTSTLWRTAPWDADGYHLKVIDWIRFFKRSLWLLHVNISVSLFGQCAMSKEVKLLSNFYDYCKEWRRVPFVKMTCVHYCRGDVSSCRIGSLSPNVYLVSRHKSYKAPLSI